MNDADKFLKTYLEQINKMTDGRSTESVVLIHGKLYKLPDKPRIKGIPKMPNRQCFANAYHLATKYEWTYVEGYALHTIPVQHAWVINDRGRLIDPTWKTLGTAYYGVELDMEYIHQVYLETETYGVLDPYSKVFRKKFFNL